MLSDSKVRPSRRDAPLLRWARGSDTLVTPVAEAPEGAGFNDPRSGGIASSVDDALCPGVGSEAAIHPHRRDGLRFGPRSTIGARSNHPWRFDDTGAGVNAMRPVRICLANSGRWRSPFDLRRLYTRHPLRLLRFITSFRYVVAERRYNLQANFTGAPALGWPMPNPGNSRISTAFTNFPFRGDL